MILVFSTSSPLVSVAAFDGRLLGSAKAFRPASASGACLEMASSVFGPDGRAGVSGVVADLGPGGFSAVKVGVTLAKTLGFALGVQVAGVSAFDLIEGTGVRAVPYKKGAWLVREGVGTVEVDAWPTEATGYGGPADDVFPHASCAEALLESLVWTDPASLLPEYGAEPSISTPRSPFRQSPGAGP